MSDVIRDGRQEPLLPDPLAERATARPWPEEWAEPYADTGPQDAADAAFIVYSVNHIEQAEADLGEALALLRELAECVTALENRSIRSHGEFHVWAEERMVTEARDAADRLLARHSGEATDGK